MTYTNRDNEFIAWYPCALEPACEADVWRVREAAFYLHVPFCEAICDYCGFSVETLRGANVDGYLDAVAAEVRHYRDAGRFADRKFSCAAVGGGTPSVLSVAQFEHLTKNIFECIPFASGSEFTVEVNPLSFTRDKASAYANAGVNRISVGVQAFNEIALKTIGRPHRAKDIWRSLEEVQSAGFSNYSLDLMYGIPGETLGDLQKDLEVAISVGAPHLSCFRLEIIPFTRLSLRRGAQLLPNSLSSDAEIEQILVDTLTKAGYVQYGAFNFAKPGFESKHNALVFDYPQTDFFGFGNSAFSYVNGVSYCNFSEVSEYVAAVSQGQSPISHARRATAIEAMSRAFVLGLKMNGVSSNCFLDQFGLKASDVFSSVIDNLTFRGLLTLMDGVYKLTDAGRHFVNNVCKEFYVGPNVGRSQHSATYIPKIGAKDVAIVKRQVQLKSVMRK